jgi:predicted permease
MISYLLPGFYAVLQLLILIAVGFAARRIGTWTQEFFTGMARFVVKIALPLYFVVRVGATDLSDLGELILMPVAAAATVAVGLGLSVLVFALSPYRDGNRRAGVAMATFGNSGYMPLTMAEVLPSAIPVLAIAAPADLVAVMVAAYLTVFSPLLWSVGNLVITWTGGSGRRIKITDIISMPLIGIIAGTVLSLVGVPGLLDRPDLPVVHVFSAIERLSAITLPLALVNLGALIGGLEIPRDAFTHYLGVAGRVLLVRYVLIPGIFFGLLFLDAFRSVAPVVVFAIFLELHTPPATNFALMVGQAGVNKEHTAVTLLLSYLAYLVVMPVAIVLLMGSGWAGGLP